MGILYHEHMDRIQDIVDLRKAGRYAQALALAQETEGALARCEEARALVRLGRAREGRDVARQALKQAQPQDQVESGLALLETLVATDGLDEAHALCVSLRDRVERESGTVSLDMALVLDHLSVVLQRKGDAPGAVGTSARVVAVLEQIEAEDAFRAHGLHTLAEAQHRAGQVGPALDTWTEVIELRRVCLRPDHPETAAAMMGKALSCRKAGLAPESARLMRDAIKGLEEGFGAIHPGVAAAHHGLGQALHRMGNFKESRKHLATALSISVQVQGMDHTDVWVTRFELGRVEVDCGDPESGFARMTEAGRVLRNRLGEAHPVVKAIRGWLPAE